MTVGTINPGMVDINDVLTVISVEMVSVCVRVVNVMRNMPISNAHNVEMSDESHLKGLIVSGFLFALLSGSYDTILWYCRLADASYVLSIDLVIDLSR